MKNKCNFNIYEDLIWYNKEQIYLIEIFWLETLYFITFLLSSYPRYNRMKSILTMKTNSICQLMSFHVLSVPFIIEFVWTVDDTERNSQNKNHMCRT